MLSSSSASGGGGCTTRLWRTAFLTLRDEVSVSPPPQSLLPLLRDLILSHPSAALASAAIDIPVDEVASDLVLLAELVTSVSNFHGAADVLLGVLRLFHSVSYKAHFDINSSSRTAIFNFLEHVVEYSLGCSSTASVHYLSADRTQGMTEILDILRFFVKASERNSSLSESNQLIRLLLCIVSCLHSELVAMYHSNEPQHPAVDVGSRAPKFRVFWEMQTTALCLLEGAITQNNFSLSKNLWISIVEALRRVTDFLSTKKLLIEDTTMSRFYSTLFNCLHVVLSNPQGSLCDHGSGFVATLKMFLIYGLSGKFSKSALSTGFESRSASHYLKYEALESGKTNQGRYRPPHRRRIERDVVRLPGDPSTSDSESSRYGFSSSESDCSDSDGYGRDGDCFRSSKTRLAAVTCIQDLCRADPKSFSSLWSMILPDSDVLQPRNYQANVMSCLLFDPVLKVRLVLASTLAAMLDERSSPFWQVAEFKESTKRAFTTLSYSLGQILMQLHRGLLHLIQHEMHSGLLLSSFKVLILLISSTPYARMPGDLLPVVIASLKTRITMDLSVRTGDFSLLVNALNCVVAAFSISSPSPFVLKFLEEEIAKGANLALEESGLVSVLLQLVEQRKHPTITLEALQALKAVAHNYPNTVTSFWTQISTSIMKLLQLPTADNSPELFSGHLKGDVSNSAGSLSERCIAVAIKVLDECLRAASGFKGTDDLYEPRLLDIQLKSDRNVSTRISSAPLYSVEFCEASHVHQEDIYSGTKMWSEIIEQHLPLGFCHTSAMVRAASVTCFAGMTKSVFSSLSEGNKEYIISSAVCSASNEETSSVRAAACRAIGVIACFPETVSSLRVLNEFVDVVKLNALDRVASVRITASWALANICDSLRHREGTLLHSEISGQMVKFEILPTLLEIALEMSKDGDKIKANAVRALGNLSRFARFTDNVGTENITTMSAEDLGLCPYKDLNSGHMTTYFNIDGNLCGNSAWLEKIVQAFVSCVTTGNVKVQWNVCHALGNLFLNPSVTLCGATWASTVFSVLLLLLRDSTNYKIRIQAAVALAVPNSGNDYGSSFSDVVQGLQHVLESLCSEQSAPPSSFKYKEDLDKQLTSTTLHVLGFVSSNNDKSLKDFLVKKASFLEEWFNFLCCSLKEANNLPSFGNPSALDKTDNMTLNYEAKKKTLNLALKSLSDVYSSCHQQAYSDRFKKLATSLC